MSTNRVRERWARGEAAVDCWLNGSSMVNAEMIGRVGFDSVIIDMQHSMADIGDVYRCLMALSGTGTAAIVRVPGNDSTAVERVLDAGADGVLCPMVNNREEAERFVAAVRYPPQGRRSIGAYRTTTSMTEHFRTANTTLLAAVQIETVEAMENLDAIATTPGLDMLYVGPADLEVSFGGDPEVDYTNPVTAERHRMIADAAHRAGIRAGMLTFSRQDTELALEWGFDFVSVGMEGWLLASSAARVLHEGRELAGAHAKERSA